MRDLPDARRQDLIDLGALGRGENLQDEVEATGTRDGTVQSLGIAGRHEKQDMRPVVELLKERKEDGGPEALPELHVRARIELLLQLAPGTVLAGGLLVQHLQRGALLLMERVPASEQLLHLVQKDDAVPELEQIPEDRLGRFGDPVRPIAKKMVRPEPDERPPERLRKLLDVGGLPGPRRAIENSAPDLLAPIRA